MSPRVHIHQWGSIPYAQAWEQQEHLLQQMLSRKLRNRTLSESDKEPIDHHLIFCEHPHVYTLGRSGKEAHLLISPQERDAHAISYHKVNRGGDITYHGPGQLVVYPLFDLDAFFTDVHRYVRYLEEAVILTLAAYNIKGIRIEGFTGVWIDGTPQRKICAIGVHLKRWITMHGLAFNVAPDLSYFDHIIPCGIKDTNKSVTSLQAECGTTPLMLPVQEQMLHHLQQLFGFECVGSLH